MVIRANRNSRPIEFRPVLKKAGQMGKRTILVTGGAGYIGNHAVLALRDARAAGEMPEKLIDPTSRQLYQDNA